MGRIIWSILWHLAYFLTSLLVDIIKEITRDKNGEHGWLAPKINDRLIFRRLLDQNKIYNLIHYFRVACTQSKMVLVQTTVV